MRPGIAPLLATALVLASLAGCGKSKEEERFEFIESTCRAMVGKTVRQAELELSFQSFVSSCNETNLIPVPGQTCAEAVPLCIVAWNFLATDRAVCGTFGCYYGCGARVLQPDLAAAGDDAVICGIEFISGNPVPPFQ